MNRNISAICAVTLLCALLIAFFGNIGIKSTSFSVAEGERKEIYLTFDDGPSDRVTPKILDILKDENVKATFFVVGRNAATRKEILAREVAEGHSVGVHSYSHDYKEIYATPQALANDAERCNDAIEAATGKRSGLYRFPGGSFNLSQEMKSAVTDLGYKCVDWNASFCDCEKLSSADEIYAAAINTPSYPQSIVMLAHDSTDKLATAEALKKVIRHFKTEGYTFLTL